jgi:membrane-bound ClpP family serine protease
MDRDAERCGLGPRPADVVKTGLVVAGLVLAVPLLRARADAPVKPAAEAGADGLFVTVHNPITTTVVNRVKDQVNRFLQRPDHRGLTLVFDFNPDSHPSGTGDYGPCHDLASFLLDLHDVATVAFVHNDVTGHTVLPVLACKDLVMSAEAKLGDALREQSRPLQKDQQVFYTTVAERRGRCPAVVLKMADKNMAVIEGTRNGAVWYIDQRQLAAEAKQGFVQTLATPVLLAGTAGLYGTVQAQKFGLCGLRKETRQELAEAYRLPARSLREDPLQGRTPVASRIEVKGAVNAALVETLKRRMTKAIAHRGVNLFVLQLDCGGGETEAARELADFFRTLKDDDGKEPVMTIAYVTDQARDTATFLALGCTEIVMDKHAHLGGFDRIVQERPKYQEAIRKSLEELAEAQGYPPLLARGMLDADVIIHRVCSQKGQLERRLLDGDELNKDKRGEQKWRSEGQVKAAGQFLNLDAEQAKELGIVRTVVDGTPADALPKIYAAYGLENVKDARMDWLDEFAAFLRHPVMAVFLVMLGITGLILELKVPGFGLPGVVAALCFVLYFWAHSQLAGHLTMLAILLFLLGLILIGVEIFLIPGFGITGISGIVLVVVSLALVTLVKKPETTQEWVEFGTTLSQFGVSLIAAIVLALGLAWYLPHVPWANRLLLPPPDAVTEEGVYPDGPNERLAALLGAVGEAATTLRPAGKARFGDDFVDVVAEGSYVEPGTRVQVIEIEGNRVVVKEV